MNKMQKEYVMKWLNGLAIAGWIVLCIVSATMGEPWHWFALGSMIIVATPIAFAMFYFPLATLVWHWRLMGVCETEAEGNVLKAWWFWMRRSDDWYGYLVNDIYERYPDEKADRESRYVLMTFLDKLTKVKKPKWL